MNIIQGDTTVIAVTINGHEYDENDTVRFGLAPGRHSQPVISKTMSYESGEYTVELTPTETAQLNADERYWFDIGVQTANGEYYRAVPCSEIWVIPGITEVNTQ